MIFPDYYRSLSKIDRAKYAKNAQVSQRYIEAHLLHRRKNPTPTTMQKLADASDGLLTYSNLTAWFYRTDSQQ